MAHLSEFYPGLSKWRLILQFVLMAIIITGNGLSNTYANSNPARDRLDTIHAEVLRLMKKGEIPGLSLVVVDHENTYVTAFGYANLQQKTAVSAVTHFEIGSCTKAFTALAFLKLEHAGLVKADRPVKDYLPWFEATYKGKAAVITVGQLLHHTSGIPQETISRIPAGNEPDALEKMVRGLTGVALNNIPGTKYEYASPNYDIIGLIIEKVSGMSFETYITTEVLQPLGMLATRMGYSSGAIPDMAQGYKIGFYKARWYQAPVYRANNAAGYLVTNANDMERWLKFQLGMLKTGTILDTLVRVSHLRDITVSPDRGSLSSYAAGWKIFLTGEGTIAHSGRNPNYFSDIRFIPEKQIGVAVMANSNSDYTTVISDHVLNILAGKEIPKDPVISDYDQSFSVLAAALLLFSLCVVAYLCVKAYSIWKGTSRFTGFTGMYMLQLFVIILILGLFLFGIYLLPEALVKFSWDTAMVWAPVSFLYMVWLLVGAIVVSFFAAVVNRVFPDDNKYLDVSPKVVVLSLISGIGNAAVIILITSSVTKIDAYTNQREYSITIFYFLLAFFAYIYCRKVVQTQLIKLAVDLIYDIRSRLLNKIFSAAYQDFEKLNRGSIYTTLNNDTDRIGYAANTIVNLITNFITTIAIFSYLMMISFKVAIATTLVIVAISLIYYKVGKQSNKLFELVRDTFTRYLDLLNGMIDGFKELSIHVHTRLSYKKDIEDVNMDFRNKSVAAQVGFVGALLAGESMLILTLALVVFVFPSIFSSLTSAVVLNYIVVMLYLIGPINTILGAIPDVMRIKVAWRRIQAFMKDLPDTVQLREGPVITDRTGNVEHLQVTGLRYQYSPEEGNKGFEVGPVEFRLNGGEALFITGSNGSGKSTLIKLLTGLYSPSEGKIEIDGKEVSAGHLGEYYSVVFNPFYLFKKLYAMEGTKDEEEINSFLEVLRLTDKVDIKNGNYTTTNLSQGQRKRLTLFQCFLEDRPIYLFDEWASDQDPEYRRFFYKELIPDMKRKGKLVIVISHDEYYFSDADLIIKLSYGKQEELLLRNEIII